MPNKVSIVLADDHPIVLAGYQHILEEEPRFQILAQAVSISDAIDLCVEHRPDILILDLGMPATESGEQSQSLAGIEVIQALKARKIGTKVLISTMLDKSPVPQRLFKAGVMGYLVKTEAADELCNAVRTVASGGKYVSPSIAEELAQDGSAQTRIEDLSKRELQIFMLLAEGLPAVEIAEKTKLSPKTVHAHRANILRKLNLKNNSDLVRFALSSGVLQQ